MPEPADCIDRTFPVVPGVAYPVAVVVAVLAAVVAMEGAVAGVDQVGWVAVVVVESVAVLDVAMNRRLAVEASLFVAARAPVVAAEMAVVVAAALALLLVAVAAVILVELELVLAQTTTVHLWHSGRLFGALASASQSDDFLPLVLVLLVAKVEVVDTIGIARLALFVVAAAIPVPAVVEKDSACARAAADPALDTVVPLHFDHPRPAY